MCVYMNVGPYACGGLIDIRNHPQYLFHLTHWIRIFKSSPERLNMDGTAGLPFLWLLDLQEGHHTHPGLMFILGIGTLGFHVRCKSPSSSQANFIQATVLLNAYTKLPWLEPQTCPVCEPGPSPQHLSAQSRSNNSTVIASVTIAVTVRGEDGQFSEFSLLLLPWAGVSWTNLNQKAVYTRTQRESRDCFSLDTFSPKPLVLYFPR